MSFHIWVPKGSTEIDWTSLSGSEKVKLLKKLPQSLLESNVLHENTKEKVSNLWIDFYNMYKLITSSDCENYEGSEIFETIKVWLSDFLY